MRKVFIVIGLVLLIIALFYCYLKWNTIYSINSYIDGLNTKGCETYMDRTEIYFNCQKQLLLLKDLDNPENLIMLFTPGFIIDDINTSISNYYNYGLTYKKKIKPSLQFYKYRICYSGNLHLKLKDKRDTHIIHPVEGNFAIKNCIPIIFQNGQIKIDEEGMKKIFKEKIKYEQKEYLNNKF